MDDCGRGGLCAGQLTPSPTSSLTQTVTPNFTATISPTLTCSPTGTPPTSTASPTPTISPTTTRTPVGGAYVLRVDVGNSVGHAAVDSSLPNWVGDQAYASGGYGYTVGGQVYRSDDAVPLAADAPLFQSYRMGSTLEYFLNLPNGTYQVTLYFSDFVSTAGGQNVFSATAQGSLVLSNLDVYAASGGRAKPLQRTFDAVVSTGVLLFQMAPLQGSCMLSAMEIRALQQQNPLVIRLREPFNAVLLP